MNLRKLKWCDITYDAILVIVTLACAWGLSDNDVVSKIVMETVAIVFVLITLSIFRAKGMTACRYICWVRLLVLSSVAVVVAIGIEPVWAGFFLKILQGQRDNAIRLLESKPHANIFLLMGLNGIYASLAGIVKVFTIESIQNLMGLKKTSNINAGK